MKIELNQTDQIWLSWILNLTKTDFNWPTNLPTIDVRAGSFIWHKPSCQWVKWDIITKPKHKRGLGIRSSRDVNMAMLGKKAWSMLHEPDKPWVAILKDRYIPNQSILSAKNIPSSSYTWNCILKSFEVRRGSIIE